MEKTTNAIVVFCINQFKLNNGTFVLKLECFTNIICHISLNFLLIFS